MRRVTARGGFTLAELMIGAAVLAIAIAALLGAFLGQQILNEHARNLTWAINDANRVLERLRALNTGCSVPTALPPTDAACGGQCASWDQWLQLAGGGKSVQPNPAVEERIVVTCENQGATAECDQDGNNVGGQVGMGEWHTNGATDTSHDPIRITVAVCWRHRNRVIPAVECSWNGTALVVSESGSDTDNVISSPAMLSTLMTCRS